MNHDTLMACHECDLLNHIGELAEGQSALCVRCGTVLYRRKPNSFDRSLALTVTGLVLFVMVNVYPLLEIKSGSLYQATTLMGSVHVLLDTGMWHVGILVFLSAVLFPFLELVCMLYILIPLYLKKRPWKLSRTLAFIQSIKPWGMMEVFMLGILVSVIKLVKMMKVIPGISLYALAILIFILAAVTTAFDFHQAWETLEAEGDA
jgi:paraquat-inducible protein A